MASGYVSSNNNRLYVASEANYGQVPAIQGSNRIPAVKFAPRQQIKRPVRKDKTGTRTYLGAPSGLRKQTTFDLTTYMTAWAAQNGEPAYGPLFQAATGGAPMAYAGGTSAGNTNPMLLTFSAAHGLSPGQAVTFGDEIRFVTAVVDTLNVGLNAPFTVSPSAGSPIGATVTYQPGSDLGSVSVFDYWDPAAAAQRILTGAAVDKLQIKVNGDYQEFEFSGTAQDLIDSTSFSAGDGELTQYPAEPGPGQFDFTIVPGNLGEAWLDNTPDQFYTITAATISMQNGLETRASEFGSEVPLSVSPGMRTATVDLTLFELTDGVTQGLYQAARQLSPVAVMFQLGQQQGQLFGVYLKSVIPELPQFDDSQTRLQWKFATCRAQGSADDEIYVAFG
jgi:hypothetical protein